MSRLTQFFVFFFPSKHSTRWSTCWIRRCWTTDTEGWPWDWDTPRFWNLRASPGSSPLRILKKDCRWMSYHAAFSVPNLVLVQGSRKMYIFLGSCSIMESLQSWSTLYDPMYCSLPGSSVHGILQAILGWVPWPPPGDLPGQGSNPGHLGLLHWQAGSLPLTSPASTYYPVQTLIYLNVNNLVSERWQLK